MAVRKKTFSLQALIRSCLLANEDAEGKVIEEEFAALTDRIAEPWDDSWSRLRFGG